MGRTEQGRPRRRQKKRMQRHRRISANSVSLKAKEEHYRTQEMELEEQIEEEKARTKEIEELSEYVGTDEYVEDVAKEKLGLIHENETIFKAE